MESVGRTTPIYKRRRSSSPLRLEASCCRRIELAILLFSRTLSLERCSDELPGRQVGHRCRGTEEGSNIFFNSVSVNATRGLYVSSPAGFTPDAATAWSSSLYCCCPHARSRAYGTVERPSGCPSGCPVDRQQRRRPACLLLRGILGKGGERYLESAEQSRTAEQNKIEG